MLGKKTVLILTEEWRAKTATALKERILLEDKSIAVIIICADELHNQPLVDYLSRKIKVNVNASRNRARFMNYLSSKRIDVVATTDNTYKGTTSYKRMENILTRYTPDVVITLGLSGVQETISVRDKNGLKLKVLALLDDFTLNKQLINSGLDGYFVENETMKLELIASNVSEDKIEIVRLPIQSYLECDIPKRSATIALKLDTNKHTALYMIKSGDKEYKQTIKTLESYSDKFNVLICVEDNVPALECAISERMNVVSGRSEIGIACAAADFIITEPNTEAIMTAFINKKLLILLEPQGVMEYRAMKYLANRAMLCDTKYKLGGFLNNYPNDKYNAFAEKGSVISDNEIAKKLLEILNS
ncbi:MAG: hypothetical protein IKM01_02595 [Clostridia bacterium]|nr:hypothetical protein [Clostridia bacterium]